MHLERSPYGVLEISEFENALMTEARVLVETLLVFKSTRPDEWTEERDRMLSQLTGFYKNEHDKEVWRRAEDLVKSEPMSRHFDIWLGE